MKFGMNLLLWTGAMNDDMIPVVASLKEMGYDGVEIPVFEDNIDLYTQWGARLQEMGLECTAVTVRGEEDNPISLDPAVRALGVENNKRALDNAAAAGAVRLVGPYHSALGIFSGQGPTEDEWKWGVDSMRQVAEHAETVGITLGVEALNRFETYLLNTHADSARFVREVDHPNARMMYDTFHANIEEKDIAQAIRDCHDVCSLVHISENDRGTPGKGNIPWNETFEAIKNSGYDGWLTIEAFGRALPDLAAATRVWRDFFPSKEEVYEEGYKFIKSHIS